MGVIASQITSLTFVFSTVYLDTDQRKHQRSASMAFVNSPHKWPVTRKMFPFDDVIMFRFCHLILQIWRYTLLIGMITRIITDICIVIHITKLLLLQRMGHQSFSIKIFSFWLWLIFDDRVWWIFNETTSKCILFVKKMPLFHCGLVKPYTQIWDSIGSGNGLLPVGTKPLPEPVLAYH